MNDRSRPDFVRVQLSAAGRRFAGTGEQLRVATGRFHYLFAGSTPVEVLRFAEWPQLAAEIDGEGNPLFELAADAPAEHGAA